MQKINTRYLFVIGFVLIFLVYSLYGIYFDLTSVPDISGKIKHANKFLFVLIIYGIGTFFLKRIAVQWMMTVWHLIHVMFIGSLLLIGLWDWYNGEISESLRNIANALFEFLISPTLFVVMGIIQFRIISMKTDRPSKSKDQKFH